MVGGRGGHRYNYALIKYTQFKVYYKYIYCNVPHAFSLLKFYQLKG